MARTSIQRRVKGKAKSALRKKVRKSPFTYIIPALFLVLGAALGYFLTPILAGDSGIAIVGDKTVTVPLGATYTYRDEGVRFTYFGIDCREHVRTSSNIDRNGDGTYVLDTSVPGTYYIAYTSTHPLFERDVRVVRTFVVGGEE